MYFFLLQPPNMHPLKIVQQCMQHWQSQHLGPDLTWFHCYASTFKDTELSCCALTGHMPQLPCPSLNTVDDIPHIQGKNAYIFKLSFIFIYIYICMYICVCVYMCVHIYVYIHDLLSVRLATNTALCTKEKEGWVQGRDPTFPSYSNWTFKNTIISWERHIQQFHPTGSFAWMVNTAQVNLVN